MVQYGLSYRISSLLLTHTLGASLHLNQHIRNVVCTVRVQKTTIHPNSNHNRYQFESEIDEQACFLEWWKSHAGAYQSSFALARKYLTTPATTFPCEPLFSVSGNIISKKRAPLLPGNVNKLVCLNNWLRD